MRTFNKCLGPLEEDKRHTQCDPTKHTCIFEQGPMIPSICPFFENERTGQKIYINTQEITPNEALEHIKYAVEHTPAKIQREEVRCR